MRREYIILSVTFVLSMHSLYGQNMDLLTIRVSGKYRGTAGSGIGVIQGVSSLDLNPAGLVSTSSVTFSLSQNLKYYSYEQFNNYNEEWAETLKWNALKYNFESLLTAIPISRRISLEMGFMQKINPFIKNYRRYTTYSILFEHKMAGSVYAFALSSGFRLFNNLSLGMTFYNYYGTLTSQLQGDNHGADKDKWATLENGLSGMNLRIGILFKRKEFSVGFILESPYSMSVKTHKSISENRTYESYFPSYDQTTWHMPLILGVGFAVARPERSTWMLDFETHQYTYSDVQLSLFEFGGEPNWKDLNILRAGIEFYPLKDRNIPMRLGYAYTPQLYASNNTTGQTSQRIVQITDYEDTNQNIKHRITAGTTLTLSKFTLNLALEYAFLKWHRNLTDHATIKDHYTERNFILSAEVIYSLELPK